MMTVMERKGKRIRLDVPVQLDLFHEDHTVAPQGDGRLHDLSAGGCAFYFEREIPVGSRVHVRILLNEELSQKFHHSELNAHGVVVRSVHEPEGYLLSVRFSPAKSSL